MVSRHRQQERARAAAGLAHGELRAGGVEANVTSDVVGVAAAHPRVRDDAGLRVEARDGDGVGIGRAHRQHALGRQRLGEPLIGGLVMRHVLIDVGVVELHARQHRGSGAVVEELWPLVEVRGVVLVAFDDHVLAAAVAVVSVVIEGHAADEERRRRARAP